MRLICKKKQFQRSNEPQEDSDVTVVNIRPRAPERGVSSISRLITPSRKPRK